MTESNPTLPTKRNWLQRIWAIAIPYFVSEEKVGVWSLIAVMGISTIIFLPLVPQIFAQFGQMTSALAAGDRERLWQAALHFFGLVLVTMIVGAIQAYTQNILVVYWRRWLTRGILGKYFQNRAYYKLTYNPEIDNPDQRIAQGIERFTGGILGMGFTIFIQVPGMAIFSSIALWKISPYLVIVTSLYGLVNVLIAIGAFARKLTELNFQQFKKEADFRSSLVRIRENAEAIAFYQGEKREAEKIEQRFQRVFENKNRLLRWNDIYLKTYNKLVMILPFLMPVLILAPEILSGKLEVGVLTESEGNFAMIVVAFQIFSLALNPFTQIFASIDRIEKLVGDLDNFQTAPTEGETLINTREESALAVSHLTLQTPDYQRTLLEDLSVDVPQGTGLLVVGESGAGKSSLLRAIAGLWQSGTGLITRPKLSEMLFLSQRPYMILGTLREQLLYPYPNKQVTEEQLRQVLQEVNLADLPERVGGFDVQANWATILSPGEQQRLAFARILIAQPRYTVLDESTSALDLKNEAHLYEKLQQTNTTFVSVGHRPSLVKFHQKVLQIGPNPEWKVTPAADYKPNEQ